jgi:hypothetical protein
MRETPERAMSNILEAHLAKRQARECFDALEGVDHDDTGAIEAVLLAKGVGPAAVKGIMSEYRTWLFQRSISG